jgi:hypothetical protein
VRVESTLSKHFIPLKSLYCTKPPTSLLGVQTTRTTTLQESLRNKSLSPCGTVIKIRNSLKNVVTKRQNNSWKLGARLEAVSRQKSKGAKSISTSPQTLQKLEVLCEQSGSQRISTLMMTLRNMIRLQTQLMVIVMKNETKWAAMTSQKGVKKILPKVWEALMSDLQRLSHFKSAIL